ncbi:MAG: hypothetical protein HW421_1 [Ignavibacteria bacterium]|nr:hypothetical protein [Ignavibacteria bacterium]
MKKTIYTIVILCIGLNIVFAQKEFNNWHFGQKAAITFNTPDGSPSPIKGSALISNQGCASISDSVGNLLFYTNGMSVWNKYHKVMPNGKNLLGHFASTQAALIVPKPNNYTTYYIFTSDYGHGTNGIRYSRVEMRLNGGNGDLDTNEKNVRLLNSATEKMISVRHKTKHAVWVIVHEWGSNKFRAYLVSQNGVDTNAVVSAAGSNHSGDDGNAAGYLKASPDGTKLALAVRASNYCELFNFNNETGVVSNPVVLKPSTKNTYGVEFSPDGTKLFIASNAENRIYQYDVTSSDPNDINNTAILIGLTKKSVIGALQLAPDGKIYFAKLYTNYLGVINYPNEYGKDCQFVDEAVFFNIDDNDRESLLGLPPPVQSFYTSFINVKTNTPLCEGSTLQLSIGEGPNIVPVSYKWQGPQGFSSNDSSPKINNVSPVQSGFYSVVVTDANSTTYTARQYVKIRGIRILKPELVEVPSVCVGSAISHSFTVSNISTDRIDFSITPPALVEVLALSLPKPKTSLNVNESVVISLTFTPDSVADYHDSIIVNVSSPCSYRIAVPISAKAAPSTVTYLDSISGIPGESISIAIKSKLFWDSPNPINLPFTAYMHISADAFLPDDMTSARLTNDTLYLKIEGNADFSSIYTEIASIKGTLLLSSNKKNEFILDSMVLGKQGYCSLTENGSLNIIGVCSFDIRKIKSYSPSKLEVSPNPAYSDISIEIFSSARGQHSIELFSPEGRKLFSQEIPGSENNISLKLKINPKEQQISSGVYFVVFKTPTGVLTKQIVIIL